jgi:hypothetical protein
MQAIIQFFQKCKSSRFLRTDQKENKKQITYVPPHVRTTPTYVPTYHPTYVRTTTFAFIYMILVVVYGSPRKEHKVSKAGFRFRPHV